MKKEKINKWEYVYVIQGNYGQGWEDLTEEETYTLGKEQLKCYDKNEPNAHRLIIRRQLTEAFKVNNNLKK